MKMGSEAPQRRLSVNLTGAFFDLSFLLGVPLYVCLSHAITRFDYASAYERDPYNLQAQVDVFGVL